MFALLIGFRCNVNLKETNVFTLCTNKKPNLEHNSESLGSIIFIVRRGTVYERDTDL